MIMNYLIQHILIWNISLICIDKLKYSVHVYHDFGYKIPFPCRGFFKMSFESFRARYISIAIKSRLKLKEITEYTIKEQFFIHNFYYYLPLKLSKTVIILYFFFFIPLYIKNISNQYFIHISSHILQISPYNQITTQVKTNNNTYRISSSSSPVRNSKRPLKILREKKHLFPRNLSKHEPRH